MFYGRDPRQDRYMTCAHIAEMIAMIGPLPLELLERGTRTAEFITEDSEYYRYYS
jgi:serine/threonine-protein kinase SRPK3